jgi:hypothetical protein
MAQPTTMTPAIKLALCEQFESAMELLRRSDDNISFVLRGDPDTMVVVAWGRAVDGLCPLVDGYMGTT